MDISTNINSNHVRGLINVVLGMLDAFALFFLQVKEELVCFFRVQSFDLIAINRLEALCACFNLQARLYVRDTRLDFLFGDFSF